MALTNRAPASGLTDRHSRWHAHRLAVGWIHPWTTRRRTGAGTTSRYTWDGTNNSLYVDGVRRCTSTTPHHDGATSRLRSSARPRGGRTSSTALIDDVRVYNAALTPTQVARLAAGATPARAATRRSRWARTRRSPAPSRSTRANLSTQHPTFNHSLTTAAAAINTGTYTVGSAAQTFPGGLTVQAGGALTLPTSGGSVQIATGKTLTMDGTLNASNTGATSGACRGRTPSRRLDRVGARRR